VRELPVRPDVLLVDATGRDHPRRAGLALQLGAVLDLPTVGVTHRPLLADGAWPEATAAGASSPLTLEEETVAIWLRTRARARPLAVHPGWRIDADTARSVVLAAAGRTRTPEPLRAARRLARVARAGALETQDVRESPPICPSCGQPASEALAGPEHGWECRNEACPEFGQPVSDDEPPAEWDTGPAR
jgi:Endonuclease V